MIRLLYAAAISAAIVLAGASADAQTPAGAPATAPASAPAGAATPPATQPQGTSQPAPATAPTSAVSAAPAAHVEATPSRPLGGGTVLWIIGIIGLVVLSGLFLVQRALATTGKWSLAEALSEEVTVTLTDAAGLPIPDAQGKPQEVTRMAASTSRLIAMLGLFAILGLYCGFGVLDLYYFGTGQGTPEGLAASRNFLLSGLTLFAPYIVNKFSSVLQPPPPTK